MLQVQIYSGICIFQPQTLTQPRCLNLHSQGSRKLRRKKWPAELQRILSYSRTLGVPARITAEVTLVKSIPVDTLVLSGPWYARENSKAVLFNTISEFSPDSGKDYNNFHSINQTLASNKRPLFRLRYGVRSMERLE